MKLKIQFFIIPVIVFALFTSCKSGGDGQGANLAPNAHMVTAEEVIQTTNYTYVRVAEKDNEYWVAINKSEIKTGETYYWMAGAEMKEFTSKELKRTFRSIFFVDDFTDKPITVAAQTPSKPMGGGRKQVPEKPGVRVAKALGGVTIAELYASAGSFRNKTVIIRGEVVKFSPDIMKRNWIHIQDGTKDGGNYDLTVTTLDSVTVGSIVQFEGTISVNKDFGSGYFYDLILENAKVK